MRKITNFYKNFVEDDVIAIGDYKYLLRGIGEGNLYWQVFAIDKNKTKYGKILDSLNEIPVTDMSGTFKGCKNLVVPPEIPSCATRLFATFIGCESLVEPPKIPDLATDIDYMFMGCHSLKRPPNLTNVKLITSLCCTFKGCTSLCLEPLVFIIPDNVTDIYSSFEGCISMSLPPIIPPYVKNMENAFYGCKSLLCAPTFPDGVENIKSVCHGCVSITEVGKIPESVKIVDWAFAYSGIKERIVFPESIKNTPNCRWFSVFWGCPLDTLNNELEYKKEK